VTYLAGMEFHFDMDYQNIDLLEAESYLKDLTSKYSDLFFNQRTEVKIQFREGSLKANIAILGAIYIGIGQYGSFRSGIDFLIQDAKALRERVTIELIKKGVSETDIIENKRLYCAPDRIRRILLAIERLESKKNYPEEYFLKELSKIKTSVSKLGYGLDADDMGLFASSINSKYWPKNRDIPSLVKRYNLLAREEDIIGYPVTSLDNLKVNKILQRTSY
jgi:hypothetical protein